MDATAPVPSPRCIPAVISGRLPSASITRRAAGAAVYLDAEGELLRQGVTAGPALIKPNQAELSGVMGRPLTTEDETIRAAQELLKSLEG